MAYIGNTVQNQGFAPAVDYFNGDGTTVTFTLSRPVASVAQLTAVIDNVIQNPSSAFTVAGSAITFTSAPLAGTNNIWVEYTSLVTTYAAISQDPSVIGDITATGGFLATGDFGNTYVDGTIVDYVTGNTRITTGPVDGMTFYNGGPTARNTLLALNTNGALGVGSSPDYGSTGQFLQSTGSGSAPVWTALSAPSVSYLIVAGGASGGSYSGSGYPPGTNGGNSVFGSLTAIGGGGGGAQGGVALNGGSGGGGSGYGTTTAGLGTSGQGCNGGGGQYNGGSSYYGGGGGGAGAVGQTASGSNGSGGVGLTTTLITTTQATTYAVGQVYSGSVYFSGGGGAGSWTNSGGGAGSGGLGGGGTGGYSGSGVAGSANSGGGGGGGDQGGGAGQGGGGAGGLLTGSTGVFSNSAYTVTVGAGGTAAPYQGAGGSGCVIISYPNTYKLAVATGTYTQTTNGSNYVFIFTGSGTITF